MDEPTQEQVVEFWEWCGLVYVISSEPLEASNSCEAMAIDTPISGWYKPDYQRGSSELISLKEAPLIDLNNLFKYAALKVGWDSPDGNCGKEITFYECGKEWGCSVGDFTQYEVADTPALALFWALWQVKEEDNASVV